jgi:hypothetical protein
LRYRFYLRQPPNSQPTSKFPLTIFDRIVPGGSGRLLAKQQAVLLLLLLILGRFLPSWHTVTVLGVPGVDAYHRDSRRARRFWAA